MAARKAKAEKSAQTIGRLVAAWRTVEPDITLRAIAHRLNERRTKTPRGKAGAKWTGKQVGRVLARVRPA